MKKTAMKKVMGVMVMMVFAATLAACGGGGTDTVANDATPDVIDQPTDTEDGEVAEDTAAGGVELTDDYYDGGMAKYTDPANYDGTYDLVTDTAYAEDCSAMFGDVVEAQSVLSNVTSSTMDATFLGSTMSFSQVATEYLPTGGDVWGYGLEFTIDQDDAICFALIASGLQYGESIDLVGYGCVNLVTNMDCMAMYERPALVNFNTISVKAVGEARNENANPKDSLQEGLWSMMQGL